MTSDHVVTLLMVYFMTTSVAAVVRVFRDGRSAIAEAVVSLGAIPVTIWVSSVVDPGKNVFASLFQSALSLNRPHCTAGGLGLALAAPWFVQAFARAGSEPMRGKVALQVVHVGSLVLTLMTGSFLAAKEVMGTILGHPEAPGGSAFAVSLAPDGFELELVATTEIIPIRITVDDTDRVFVSGHRGVAAQSGCVVELLFDGKGGVVEKTVASSLNRPYGLAARGGELFVSRSGQFTRAVDGKLVHEATGAVTRLRDCDGDGEFDWYEDVVSGLPGSRGPDYLHQNNDIAFDAAGHLYVTSGANSDRGPLRHEWEGTILRTSPDFKDVEVFASGLRNTFGLAIGPREHVFCTDNDVNADPGDELNFVIQGRHYGHPFALANDDLGADFTKPILVSKGALAGLCYVASPELPPEYRDCLYTVVAGHGTVNRIRLLWDGTGYKTELSRFVDIKGAVDVAVSRRGVFWVACYDSREIYRVKYVGEGEG